METLLAIGIGIGLASVAGVRAFLPLALVGLFARLGLFELPAPFGFMDDWAAIGAFLVLALLETGLDKLPSLSRTLNLVQTPIRIIAGAFLFALALQEGLNAGAVPELIVGGVIAGVVAVLKYILRPPANAPANASSAGTSSSFLSTFEDVVALVGGIIAVLVPLLPLALVAFLLYFFFRIRRRRGKKFGGLRILGD